MKYTYAVEGEGTTHVCSIERPYQYTKLLI